MACGEMSLRAQTPAGEHACAPGAQGRAGDSRTRLSRTAPTETVRTRAECGSRGVVSGMPSHQGRSAHGFRYPGVDRTALAVALTCLA